MRFHNAKLRYFTSSLNLRESITHGTKAKILELNKKSSADDQVIDLSIGTLDEKTNSGIDDAVKSYISNNAAIIHEFAQLKASLSYERLLLSV